MLEVINRYIHGYVAISVIIACREKGIFSSLYEQPKSFGQLIKTFSANEGYLKIALNMFESLNWVKLNSALSYELIIDENSYQFIQGIPRQLLFLYKVPVEFLFSTTENRGLLSECINKILNYPNKTPELLVKFLQGVVIVPVLIALKMSFQVENLHSNNVSVFLRGLPTNLQEIILQLFAHAGLVEDGIEKNMLTNLGEFLFDRAFNMATAASYAPMLSNIDEILFGDSQKIFFNDNDGHELHINRTLNVIASGFQHGRYFEDFVNVILPIFNKLPIEEQPKYIVDMGCGDGSLLRKIYEAIETKSTRGEVLNKFPLYLIGVDYNQKSLDVTGKNLTGIPHLTLVADITRPEELIFNLKSLGITDVDNCLHIRSFLDHNRPYIPPDPINVSALRKKISYRGVYIDRNGRLISPSSMIQNLVDHLGRWASIISKHGLIILEVHHLRPEVVSKYLNENESLHFDALQAFSFQYLVEAEVFLISAAEVGLFPKIELSKRYPRVFPYTRITLNFFEKRPYTIQYAQIEDIAELIQLEILCWPEQLRASPEELCNRIEKYPTGQLILKTNQKILGVIYTQRISDSNELKKVQFKNISTLHISTGPVLQLLAINILPEVQGQAFGHQLLEFCLQLCSMKNGVEKIVGVTRCKSYKNDPKLTLQEYIDQHINIPGGIDPILRFHTRHGANIVGIINDYRPEDIDNQGSGILIEYKLNNERVFHSSTSSNDNVIENTILESDFKNIIFSCVKGLLPDKFKSRFSPVSTLREMGIDSLGLLEFSALINKKFGIKLRPAFLFKYNTPAMIAQYLETYITEQALFDREVEVELDSRW